MKNKVDFTRYITEHIVWNVRLKCFLDGGECITEQQAVSAEQCSLGTWLNSSAIKEYKNSPGFMELNSVHKKMHEKVKKVVLAKHSGDIKLAEKGLKELHKINDSIIKLLTSLDEYF
jgi:hypothetical protein